jgi:hypothetical protein
MTTYGNIYRIFSCFKLILTCQSENFETFLWHLNLIWVKYLTCSSFNRATYISTETIYYSTSKHDIPYSSDHLIIRRRISSKLVRSITNEIFPFIDYDFMLHKRLRGKIKLCSCHNFIIKVHTCT